MGSLRKLKHLVFVLVILSAVECRRSSSGGRSRSSYSRHSYSRPSYSSPSYSHPSPSYSHPSPSYSHPSPSSNSRPSSSHPSPASLSYPEHRSPSASRPLGFENVKPSGSGAGGHPVGPPVSTKPLNSAPNYGFNPSVTHGAGSGGNIQGGSHGATPPQIGFKPSVTQGAGSQPKPSAPVEHATNVKPVGSSNVGTDVKPPPYGFKPSAPVGPPTNVKPVGNLPPGAPYPVHPPPYTPHNPGVPPPAYSPAGHSPAYNPAGYGPPPAYNPAGYGSSPAYNPGYGHSAYPQQQYHAGGYPYQNQHPYGGFPGGITNVNINNYNTHSSPYGGGFGGFGGYAPSYPSYHYSHSDVGSGTLGFFLGYSLAKVTTPTFYSHSGFNNGYTPRYDHYEVHHYYHNRDSIPAQTTIQPNTIVGCIGDSGTICPVGTTSLCTNNGAILCVASASSIVPCTDQKQANCVKTTIPCVNGTGDCTVGQNKTMSIPCISTAKVAGNITYVNNTIIVNNTTIVNNIGNGTITKTNTTGVEHPANLTSTVTTLVNNITVTNTNSSDTQNSTSSPRSKRAVVQVPINELCVTILALPAERKPTEQEQLFESGTNLFAKFLVRAFGANKI